MLDQIKRHAEGATALEEIIICVLDSRQQEAFRSRLAGLA